MADVLSTGEIIVLQDSISQPPLKRFLTVVVGNFAATKQEYYKGRIQETKNEGTRHRKKSIFGGLTHYFLPFDYNNKAIPSPAIANLLNVFEVNIVGAFPGGLGTTPFSQRGVAFARLL